MRKALVIGNDNYPGHELSGCINDAQRIAELLRRHGNGDPNFDVRYLDDLGNVDIDHAVKDLFSGSAEIALLYFAGHGFLDNESNSGYIVGVDGGPSGWGMSFQSILEIARKSMPKIQSTVVMIDCCHAGALGEVAGLGSASVSVIPDGVTLLTACERGQAAEEDDIKGQGIFTDLAVDALSGGAADVIGRITPASVYSHVDQSLGDWQQRPVYKANVSRFVELRKVEPKVDRKIIRKLPLYFSNPTDEYILDESYEKTDTSAVPQHVEILTELQICNRASLITPVGEVDMYFAAINRKSCRLTALGAHYYRLAKAGRI